MTTADRLAAALASDDLGWAPNGTGDVEYVAALGYIGIHHKAATALYRLMQTLDAASYQEALRETRRLVGKMNSRYRWHLVGQQFNQLAEAALQFCLCPVCPSCFGRKYRLIHGSDRHLSDRECPACQGTGIRRVRGPDKDRIRDVAAALVGMNDCVAGGVKNRLFNKE